MRHGTAIRALVGGLIGLLPALHAGAHCTPEKSLEDYLNANTTEDGTLVLALDHRLGMSWWQGYRWNGAALVALSEPQLTLEAADKPRLMVPRQAPLAVFLIDTNPLIYTLTPGESSEKDREDLANIQQLASLLGNQLSAAAAILTQVTVKGQDVEVKSAALAQGVDETARIFELSISDATRAVALQQDLPRFDEIATRVESSRYELKSALDKMTVATAALESELKNYERAAGETDAYLRGIEMESAKFDPARSWPSQTALDPAFAGLESATKKLDAVSKPCNTELGQLERALELKLRGLVGLDPFERSRRVEEYAKLAEKLRTTSGCPELRDPLREVGIWFGRNPLDPSGPPRGVAIVLEPVQKLLREYLDLWSKRDQALGTAKELLAKQGAVTKEAQRYAILEARQRKYLGSNPTACMLDYGVLRIPRAQGDLVDVDWSKIRSESFSVAFDKTFEGVVIPTRRTEVKASYELERRPQWYRFDVDFGLIGTDITDPMFSAVTRAAGDGGAAAATAEGEEEEPKKVVSITDEESRTGEIALFGTWTPWNPGKLHLGPQLGVGLDPDKPMFFAGVAVGFGEYVKLSGGWSWQEVRELDPSQVLDVTVVGSDDDIKLRRDFDDDWYLALTVSIDNLPIFSGGGGGSEE